MSDSQNAGFSQFVPGFDFLQNLAKGAAPAVPQMPNLGSWIAPTLNVEELDKRISELKAVHFWLDQNSKALGATVQALEVQKMTLATLKGMNFNIGEMASALTPKAAEPVAPKASEKPVAPSKTIAEMAAEAESVAEKEAEKASPAAKPAAAKAAAGLVDPLQLWGALTQQFQQIAASAMKDAGNTSALDLTKNMAAGFAKEAVKATKKAAAKPKAPAKKAARKTSARSG
jgi:hypothetical protein